MAVIAGLMLFIFGIIYFAISSYVQSLTDDIAQLNAKSSGNEAQFMQLQKQVEDATEAAEFYKAFTEKGGSSAQSYRRDYAKDLLVKMKDDHNITELKFSMDQFLKQTGEYEKPEVAVFVSKVTIQFSANSDVEVFNLIKDITQNFPGSVRVDSIRMSRSRNMDDIFLDQIADGRKVPLVNGEIILGWRGIQDNPEYTGKAQKAKRPPPGGDPSLPPGGPPPGVGASLSLPMNADGGHV